MSDERRQGRAFVWKLVLADALTPRGEIGPLERVWAPGFERRPLRRRPPQPEREEEGPEGEQGDG